MTGTESKGMLLPAELSSQYSKVKLPHVPVYKAIPASANGVLDDGSVVISKLPVNPAVNFNHTSPVTPFEKLVHDGAGYPAVGDGVEHSVVYVEYVQP